MEEVIVRPYEPADAAQIRWLHDRTPPAGQVARQPQPWPAALDEIPANFAAFWVAVGPTSKGEAVVAMLGLARAGSAMEATPAPAFMGPLGTDGPD